MKQTLRSDWVTEAYSAKLEEFAAEHGVSYATVEAAFCDHCATFQSAVVDGTSQEVVRGLASQKLHWHPPEPEGITTPE